MVLRPGLVLNEICPFGAAVTPLQPVDWFSFEACRLKPPTNEPHGILALLSRVPIFGAFDMIVVPDPPGWTAGEHTSRVGSKSAISVKSSAKPVVPSGIT